MFSPISIQYFFLSSPTYHISRVRFSIHHLVFTWIGFRSTRQSCFSYELFFQDLKPGVTDLPFRGVMIVFVLLVS